MTPLIGTTTWSTDSIDERERFSFWREMVCRNVSNIPVQAPAETVLGQHHGTQPWNASIRHVRIHRL